MSLRTCFRGGNQDQRAGWWLHFSYDADKVDELKRRVPARDRVWDGTAKLWWVSVEHEATLEQLFPDFAAYLAQGQLL